MFWQIVLSKIWYKTLILVMFYRLWQTTTPIKTVYCNGLFIEGCRQLCWNLFLGGGMLSDRFARMAFLEKKSYHFLIKSDHKINPLLEQQRKKVLGAKWLSWTNLQIVWSRIWAFGFFTHRFWKISLRDFNFSEKANIDHFRSQIGPT